ncbi:hypothetical protein Pla100_41120 [Neorhodopirellula pilleata]|uniref:Uncharacterized protein n=2 Tax=Neorhodopirellula pilleata TaxID=2714738 RepID=A0A5C6A195_9BACT|nr:hypothetical protein Pla100_41120 [Neorhodopirellula pilleata]
MKPGTPEGNNQPIDFLNDPDVVTVNEMRDRYRLGQEFKNTSPLLLACDHNKADSFKPTPTDLTTRPLRHPPMDCHKTNRLFG